MIAKVFEKYTYAEIQKVKKTIQEKEQEVYFEIVTRTERVYEPPTGVTHCLKCGVLLKDSMWYYSKSGKYLCPHDWYYTTTATEREKYRQQAQRMSTGGYSYKNVTDKVRKTRTITKNKEIEVEESITKDGLKLVWPIDINYKDDNKIIYQKVSFFNTITNSDALAPHNFFTDDEINKDQSWFNATSYKNAITKIEEEKPINEIEKITIFNLGPIPYNEVIIDEKQVLEEFMDVVGYYPNVPAFIQGHPLNMYNNKRKNIVNIDKVISIYCNLAIDSKCDFSHYKSRGIILYTLIEYLINNDFKINLILLDATFIDGETIIQELESQIYKKLDFKNSEINKLKEEQDKHLNHLYNILTSLSYYRVLLLENKANIIKTQKLNDKWSDGFGYCMKTNDLKNILNLDEDIIVIGNPFEHNINGLFLDDDFSNCMDSVGIYTDIEESSDDAKKAVGKIHSAKEVIHNRGITKLIHVTAKENIPSINKLGILSKATLEKQKRIFHQNDYQRLDKHTDAICLSISEPNIFLFREFSKKNPYIEYQVIEIDPKILYEIKDGNKEVKRIYSDYNAASRFSKKSEEDMEVMFHDRIRRKGIIHTREGLKSYQPTSTQAEILFFGDISPQYILNVKSFNFQEENSDTRKEPYPKFAEKLVI